MTANRFHIICRDTGNELAYDTDSHTPDQALSAFRDFDWRTIVEEAVKESHDDATKQALKEFGKSCENNLSESLEAVPDRKCPQCEASFEYDDPEFRTSGVLCDRCRVVDGTLGQVERLISCSTLKADILAALTGKQETGAGTVDQRFIEKLHGIERWSRILDWSRIEWKAELSDAECFERIRSRLTRTLDCSVQEIMQLTLVEAESVLATGETDSGDWSQSRSPSEWLTLLRKTYKMGAETFRRMRTDKHSIRIRQHPDSSRKSISLSLTDLERLGYKGD
ncbi:MAG: hypothetical protein HQ518_32605 [Rhodopirellula sp.]|nr:hypothetical protein [Rhodopirellula sp.]